MSSASVDAYAGTRGGSPARRRSAIVGIVALVSLVLVSFSASAHASVPGDLAPIADPRFGPNTDIEVTNIGAGQNITGFAPSATTAQDPTAPYPATEPTTGYDPVSRRFGGILTTASIEDPTLTAQMYCIDLRVPVAPGLGYASGTWTESNVPNIGYVAYILNSYYPTVDAPAGLTANQQAAAVQAAIWYFTDGYVLGTDAAQAAVRNAAAAIVAAAQANGPVVEPPPPDVTITPPAAAAPAGSPAGPFVVAAENAAEVTVSVPTGFTMYSDAAGTTEIANPSTLPSGTQIYVGSAAAATATSTALSARAVVTVPRGEVYLYDRNNPDFADGQPLILAATTELEATAQAGAEFFEAGELSVTKAFLGDALGQQGASQLRADCGEGYVFTADVPAGASAAQEFTFSGIPVGRTCTVTEPVRGVTAAVEVTSDAPQEVVTTAEGEAVVVTNTVVFRPGGLTVTKAITGTGAGLQGEVGVRVVCGNVLDETFTLPAGTVAGSYVQSYTGLAAGTECTVTETGTGAAEGIQIRTSTNPVTVAIQPGTTVDAGITNEVTRETPPTPTPTPTPTQDKATTGNLAYTGVSLTPLLWAGLGSFVGGTVLLASFRRRGDGAGE